MGRSRPSGASNLRIARELVDVELKPSGMLSDPERDESFGAPFPAALAIPRRDWRAKIEELEETDPFNGPHPKGCILANLAPKVFNQHPESSCVLNGAAGAMMRRFAIENGLENAVVLSPMSGYCRLATHRHSGTYCWRALELCRDEGLLPSSTWRNQAEVFEHTLHENTPFLWPRSLPRGWQSTARQFRVLEWCRITELEEYASALLAGMPVLIGRSGHAMVAESLVLDRGKFYARICDSYGFDARDGTGRIYDSERTMSRSTGGAWACRVMTRPDNLFEWSLS